DGPRACGELWRLSADAGRGDLRHYRPPQHGDPDSRCVPRSHPSSPLVWFLVKSISPSYSTMALAPCRIMLNPPLLKAPCRYARRVLLDIHAVWMGRGLTPGRGPCVLLRVQRPGPRALDEEKKRAEQLGQVGAAFVQDGPEAGLGRDRGQGQGGRAQEQGDFGGENGHEHLA